MLPDPTAGALATPPPQRLPVTGWPGGPWLALAPWQPPGHPLLPRLLAKPCVTATLTAQAGHPSLQLSPRDPRTLSPHPGLPSCPGAGPVLARGRCGAGLGPGAAPPRSGGRRAGVGTQPHPAPCALCFSCGDTCRWRTHGQPQSASGGLSGGSVQPFLLPAEASGGGAAPARAPGRSGWCLLSTPPCVDAGGCLGPSAKPEGGRDLGGDPVS